jgi:hypothetical protein
MDNVIGEYDFSFVEGDSFAGFSIRLTTKEDVGAEPIPVNLTGCTIQLRIQSIDKVRVRHSDLTTYNKRIVVTDAVDGKFSIVSQKIKLPAGMYEHSLQVKFPDGFQRTYLIGNCEVLDNSTSKSY